MKRFFTIFMLILVLSLMLATFVSAAGPEKITIGVNAELTGSVPVVGESCKNAAELAVKEINDAGGLDISSVKYPVELLIEDNEDKAESAA
ncbi:MAG: ABC transporter substrate-binding protein, partial [Smithella sp.]